MLDIIILEPTKTGLRLFPRHFTKGKRYVAKYHRTGSHEGIKYYEYHTDRDTGMVVREDLANTEYVKRVVLKNLIGGKLC